MGNGSCDWLHAVLNCDDYTARISAGKTKTEKDANMSPILLMALQSGLVTLQIINAGLATVHASPVLALIIGAVVGGVQTFVQNMGNKTVPPPPPVK